VLLLLRCDYHQFYGVNPIQLARDELPIPVKVEFDAYYLKNRSFFFDLKILWMTFVKVVKREGVRH